MSKQRNTHKHKHTDADTHTQPFSESTLTPWKGLLIDQSALTAVWRELLTLWLQRVCVQWPCKGLLALTLGVSALPWRRWCAHIHTHTCRRDYYSTPKPLRYAQPQSSKCVHPVWRWRHRWVLPPATCAQVLPVSSAWLLPPSGRKVSKFSTPTSETLTNACALWHNPATSHSAASCWRVFNHACRLRVLISSYWDSKQGHHVTCKFVYGHNIARAVCEETLKKDINFCRMRPSNIAILMVVMKIDELFSFSDFTGSRREEGKLPDCLFTFALFKWSLSSQHLLHITTQISVLMTAIMPVLTHLLQHERSHIHCL